MQISSMGDLAHSLTMQSRNNVLKQEMQRLTTELTSGQVADMRAATKGNVAYVNDLERSLKKLDGYDLATREAIQFADGVQNALGRISELNMSFRNTVLTSNAATLSGPGRTVFVEARATLDGMIDAMNGSVGGRMLFSGTATDTSPAAPAQDLLAALGAAMSGAANVDDMLTAAQAWFDDPAGYGAVGYRGSDTALAPMSLSDGKSVKFDLRANDPSFRNALRSAAVIALADDASLGLDAAQKSELIQKSAGTVLGTTDAFIALQARFGVAESILEAQTSRNGAERTTLERARSDLLSIDPFKTATELEQVQFQLQSLYAITSRMSQLSLLNYI
jgi:flagellar hook-associated protein 3 FlgL